MAALGIMRPSKWFSNKNLKLTLNLLPPIFITKKKPPNSTPTLLTLESNTQEEKYGQVFRFLDNNNDGKISSDELRVYFMSMGESMSQEEAQKVINEFDANGNSVLEFAEFVQLMERDNKEGDDDLRRAFKMFEDDNGSGGITPKGLQVVLRRLGSTKSDEECEAMIRLFDLDGNGVLDFHEFHKMMS